MCVQINEISDSRSSSGKGWRVRSCASRARMTRFKSYISAACIGAAALVGCGATQARPERGPAAAASPSPPATNATKPRVLAFLGDSLTAGQGLAVENSFPSLIAQRIESEGLGWTVVNAGVSGDTTRTALARLDWVLRAEPAIMFICLGANDGLRGIDPGETQRHLRAIIERVRAAGTEIILAGMQMPGNYGPEHAEEFAAVFPRLAEQYDLAYLPFLLEGVGLDPKLNLADGIHPNVEGQKRVADNVWPLVKRQITQPKWTTRDGPE